MLSSAELGAALSVLEAEECAALWAAAGAGGAGLVRALLAAGGQRAAAVLAAAPDNMARVVLEHMTDALRGAPAVRRVALATCAPLLALRPAWLPRAPAQALAPLAAALARTARTERDAVPTLHALLSLAALIPTAPACASAIWTDLPAALLRPNTSSHLQLAQLALFHALYATHPCTLLDALRNELATTPGARAIFEKNLGTLLRSARLHPGLLSGSRQREADVNRWARAEPHDILAEAHALSGPAPPLSASPPPPASPVPPSEPAPGSVAWAALSVNTLRPGSDGWFALSETVGVGGAPPTPVPVDVEPEAAVEATPENTPARETRAAFRFPGEGGAVRAIGRRSPRAEPSPPADGAPAASGASGRLARVLSERRALESPVSFASGAPAGVARPEPRAAVDHEEAAWEAAPDTDPRELLSTLSSLTLSTRRPRPRHAAAPPPRRARSQPPRGVRRESVGVQTEEKWPEPYEFLIADLYRDLREDTSKAPQSCEPSDQLESYLSSLVSGTSPTSPAAPAGGVGIGGAGDALAEQLAMAQAMLMFERWRRDTHAERNRRLLGRVRSARATELTHAQLLATNEQLLSERSELRQRLAHAKARHEHCTPPSDREKELESMLCSERAQRARAEARVAELEAWRGDTGAASRNDSYDNSDEQIHLQALARAAVVAGPRATHVRRLQRHLLICAEREQRILDAIEDAPHTRAARTDRAHDTAACRALAARAEHDAAAANARVDSLNARVTELEQLLAQKEQGLLEVRRQARAAGTEHAARQQAMRDKYEALLRVLRAAEERQLARRAHDELAAPPRHAPPPPPRSVEQDDDGDS